MNEKLWTRNYILLAAGNLFMTIGFYFLMPTLPVYVIDVLGAQKHDVGYILAAYTISALIIRPFTGYAIDAIGRKWIYLISFLIFALMLSVYPFMLTFAALFALRFFHGFTWGITTTTGSTTVVDIIPSTKRGRGIGYYGMSFTISMALGPVIAITILHRFGFRPMFYSASCFALFGLLLASFVKYPSMPRPAKKQHFSWKNFIEKSSLPMALTHILFGITYGGVISYITLFDKEHQFNASGPFFLIIAGGIFLSRLFAGRIFDRSGPYRLMITGFVVTILGFLVLSLLHNTGCFLLSAFLIGMGSGILMPSVQTMVNNVVGIERRGAANATITTAFDLGIGMGSLFLGFLSELIGLAGMYLSCTLVLAAALIFFITYVHDYYVQHLYQG